ncbi:MAG TPA: SpoIIE family protein phosphatase [Actinomycetota bacterium]|nr:SpoIIE family protein phosphatase [Actinomycetota bacterium]
MHASVRQPIERGSWRWAIHVAELMAWFTTAFVLVAVVTAGLPSGELRAGVALVAALALWVFVLFRVVVPRARPDGPVAWTSLLVDVAFATAIFYLLRGHIGSAQLVFVPVIAGTGLMGHVPLAIAGAVLSLAGYWGAAELTGSPPGAVEGTLYSGVFVMSGLIAALLARELRRHYLGEQREHRLATAVRHRLMAVVDAVDEAIVFSDRQGLVRVVNRRAGELFGVEPDDHFGRPVVQLLRVIARMTEEPEDFMESFQQIRDDPELELRHTVEQIVPVRRQLRVYSGPTRDESGALVGRIDVFTDVSESVRRAAEVERLYEQARTTAESYQRSLLPSDVPSVPRVGIVAHYVPAAGRRAVCGDFYDFVTMPDGRLGVVLGDVCGIGPEAVSDAALTRYSLGSYVEEESDPARLLDRLNAHVADRLGRERFVRLMLGVLDPERARFAYANAGHVPPVLYRAADGEVQWLGEGGVPLGLDPDADYKAGFVEFHPGDMLVLYTDGVTEAPRDGQPFGQGRFLDIVRQYGVGTPGELAQAVRRSVDAWVGRGELRDDIALLVCQVVPDDTLGEPSRELVLPNDPARMAELRAFAAAFLADVRAPVETSTEILMAVGEAAANACRHGRRADGRSEVRVRCALDGTSVVVTVADDGPGFDPAEVEARPRDRYAAGGRGLYLMRELMDEVDVAPSPDGTTVTMRRAVFGAGHPMAAATAGGG